MSYVTAVFAVFARLLRPRCGVHSSPLGYFRELAGEVRRRRARRVRRYVQDLPVAAVPEPEEERVPWVPAQRLPVDDTLFSVLGQGPGSAIEADAAVVAEGLVRSYYRAWEHQQKLLHLGCSRRGVSA